MKNTRLYITHDDAETIEQSESLFTEDGIEKQMFLGYQGSFKENELFDYPSIEGNRQIKGLMNGRIPKKVSGEFEEFYFSY